MLKHGAALDLAGHVAARVRAKELLKEWIRGKASAGGSIHDYYPPSPEKMMACEAETGRTAPPIDSTRGGSQRENH